MTLRNDVLQLRPPTSFPSPNATQAAVYTQFTTLNSILDSLPPSSLSPMEAEFYYAGLPSSPVLVARTSTRPWVMPEGPEAYRVLKQLYPVFNHKLNTVWDRGLGRKVYTYLDEMDVKWTSIDIVRIGEVGESSPPIVIWIGVVPKSLSGEDGNTVAFRCLNALHEFDITDVDIEIRESSVTRSAGPKLLEPALTYDPTADVCSPLTHALGIPIAAQATPYAVGTGGFFMAEGGDSNKLLLVTARHVVFPPKKGPNNKFERKFVSQPRSNVLLLGDKAYQDLLTSIKTRIRQHRVMVEYGERRVKAVEGKDGKVAKKERESAQRKVDEAKEAMEALYTFYQGAEKNWNTHAGRVLGHVVYSPPISLGTGTEGYTEDYAIIEVDDDKIDRSTFQGNVIDLGTKISVWEFTNKMYPNPKNSTTFKYPDDRLLKLRGTIKDEEMRQPTMLDQNDQPCLVVIKSGNTTGVTIGRATGVMSIIRESFDDDSHQTSMEWAILPYDNKSGPFSAPGDSGSVIVDSLGRMGGLLTGGAGVTDSSDITYATPIDFLIQSIKANGYPNAHPNPA